MCLENIDVAIICGGQGTRIRKTLGDTPKVLALVNGRPYLDYIVARLRRLHAHRIVLCTGHLTGKIAKWYDRQPREIQMDVHLSVEEEPLGTAGAVRNAALFLHSDPVLILNGDTLSTIDLCAMVESYQGLPMTVQTYIYESGGEMEYAGHYLLPQEALDQTKPFNDIAVFFAYLQERRKAVAYRIMNACYLDIGSPEDYAKAGRFVKEFGIDP